jgi:hypothetical protein
MYLTKQEIQKKLNLSENNFIAIQEVCYQGVWRKNFYKGVESRSQEDYLCRINVLQLKSIIPCEKNVKTGEMWCLIETVYGQKYCKIGLI